MDDDNSSVPRDEISRAHVSYLLLISIVHKSPQKIARARHQAVSSTIHKQAAEIAQSHSQSQVNDLKQSIKRQIEVSEQLKANLEARELELREARYELSRLQAQQAQSQQVQASAHSQLSRKSEMKYKQDITRLRNTLEKIEVQGLT